MLALVSAAFAAPTALAGLDFSAYPGWTVELNGSAEGATDPVYTWTQVGGPDVKLERVSSPAPSFVPSVAATYTFQLVVTEGDSPSEPDTVSVIVVERDAAAFGTEPGCNTAGGLGGLGMALAALFGLRRR